MSRPFFFLDFIHLFNTITLHHGQELPTLLTILIVDVKSGRVGDEAKKPKSPSKSGRVGISGNFSYVSLENALKRLPARQGNPPTQGTQST